MMKTLFLIILSLILPAALFSQEIEFRKGSWKEMLAASKAENKMVMTDFTTIWCGVCRIMEKKVFTEKEVADFFNKNFICYHLDAEKGEGKEIAHQYEISSFPTFLFVDKDGNMIYKAIGYMDSQQFIACGQEALNEFRSPYKNLKEWENEYVRKKNNPDFVRKYLEKRTKLKMENADILDQYCSICPEIELLKPDLLQIITNQKTGINAGGPCYRFIVRNLPEICPAVHQNEKRALYTLQEKIIGYSLSKAIRMKNDSLLSALLEANALFSSKLEEDSLYSALKIKCRYYSGVRNHEAYERNAILMAEYLLKDKEKCLRADSLEYETFLDALAKSPEKLDSLVRDYNYMGKPLDVDILRIAFKNLPHQHTSQLAYKLSELARQASRVAENPDFLKQVLFWAIESVTLYDHFSTEAILAEVMYMSGNRQEAINWMKEARKKAIRDTKNTKGFAAQMQQTLEKMENNQPL